jgi:hypothetical protein
MKEAVFIGVMVGVFASLAIGGIAMFRDLEKRSKHTADTFKSACESTGGRPAWNMKHWECLK